MIPLWFVFALGAAFATTLVPLLQEKIKAEGFVLVIWNKFFIALFTLPTLFYVGLPENPLFYLCIALTAIIYSISDVIYFRAVPIVGSGVVTRLMPVSVVATFFLWFIVEPQLWAEYWVNPYKMVAIISIFALFLYFSSRLRQCAVSWQGVRLLWPVILAACIGIMLSKFSLQYAGSVQAPFAYIAVQSLMMFICLSLFYVWRRPVARTLLFSKEAARSGGMLAMVSIIMILLKVKALQLVDNPGLVSLVIFTDVLWVLLVYKLIGKKETANIWAGLGIVVCAAAAVTVKSFF